MDWDLNFDDILKEYGIDPEGEDSSAADAPEPEEKLPADPADEFLTEPEAKEPAEEEWPAETPDQNENRDDAQSEPEDEFGFNWPEPEAEEPARRRTRNYDPEKYPDAIRARKKEEARQKREQEARLKAEARDAERRKKEQEREEERQLKEQEREAAKASREAARQAEIRAREAERKGRERDRHDREEGRRRVKEEQRRKSYQERRQGTIGLVVFLLVLAVITGGVIYAGNRVTHSNRNLPKVFVNDIAVGKMTKAETENTLIAAGWQQKESTPLKVSTYGGVSVEISPLEAGAMIPLEQAVNAAVAYGHSGNMFSNLLAYLQNLTVPVDVNEKAAEMNGAFIQQKAFELNEALAEYLGDEAYSVDIPGEKLLVRKGQGTASLDTRELAVSIADALAAGQTELYFGTLSSYAEMPDFDALFTELSAEPENARYSDDGKFTVLPETDGVWFDTAAAKAAWEAAEVGETVTVPVRVTYPEVTAEALRSRLFHDMLGAQTTKYTNSGDNRCSNVRLATSKVNGIILYPGETFSYNETVGARTEEAGFLPAPAYAGVGEDGVKDEIGGGACQVSSTLYAATAYAFLETVERTAHIYPVNYIQMGTDATVTIPEEGGQVMDLRFKNSKNYPIKLVGYTEETDEEKTVTFEIWGTLEDGDYMPVEFDNSWYWMLDYDRVIEPSYPDRQGYKIKFTHETYAFEDAIGYGSRTLTHREVYKADNGELVLDEIINPRIPSGYAMDTYYSH